MNQMAAIDMLTAFPLVKAVSCGAEGIRTPDPLDANEVRLFILAWTLTMRLAKMQVKGSA
jgi:hypothetical protein